MLCNDPQSCLVKSWHSEWGKKASLNHGHFICKFPLSFLTVLLSPANEHSVFPLLVFLPQVPSEATCSACVVSFACAVHWWWEGHKRWINEKMYASVFLTFEYSPFLCHYFLYSLIILLFSQPFEIVLCDSSISLKMARYFIFVFLVLQSLNPGNLIFFFFFVSHTSAGGIESTQGYTTRNLLTSLTT